MKVVKIRGRNRLDVKKRILDYYFSDYAHRLPLRDFLNRCAIDPRGKTVIYREE